jgi:protein TonB
MVAVFFAHRLTSPEKSEARKRVHRPSLARGTYSRHRVSMRIRTWLSAAGLVAVVACVRAEPPLINVLYPPPGYVGPQEDAAHPHLPPEIPERAQRCKEKGTIKITLIVAADGTVPSAAASVSTGFPDLDAAALVRVRRWHFIPATKDGVAVAVRMVTTLDLISEGSVPNFAADCSAVGAQTAADEIWKKSGLQP